MRVISACLFLALSIPAGAASSDSDEARWLMLKSAFFGEKAIHDGAGVISLEAPYRAHDAAVVPIKVNAEVPQDADRYIKTITLIIDKNPVPMAGVFRLSPDNGIATLSTRVRVNEYTNVRAVAETNDGQLYMATKFVKGSGGCSAPAQKDAEAALARQGKMRLRQIGDLAFKEPNQIQLLISHPNSTGMQMDQVSRHYIPAHFVRDIEVRYAGKPILSAQTNISLSEDPSIRFYYVPDGPGELTVEVLDTADRQYSRSWAIPTDSGS